MRRLLSAVIAALFIASPAIAANVDLGVKTQAAPIASTPYTSSDSIPLVRGTTWDRILATILNPCSATLPGTVPTPPNDASKFLNGQCGWTTPASSGGITVNSTSITGGATGRLLYDNAGSVGEAIIGPGLSLVGGTLTAPGGGGWGIVGTSIITSGTTGRLLYDNAGVLGELALGTGVSTWLTTPSPTNFAAALTGAVTVPAGGTGATGIAANAVIKGNGTSPFTATSITADGTTISITDPLDLTNKAVEKEIANAGVTGTTLNKLAKLSGSPSRAVIAATTDTDGAIGIVTGGAGTTSVARIAIVGQVSCVFDGSTTAGDFVIISPSVAGDCRDGGSTRPAGAQTIGRVLTTNGAGGTFTVDLDLGFANTAGGAGIVVSGTTAGTNAQTMAASFSFLDGNVVVAKIGSTNTAAATLNVNLTGVKTIAAQDATGALSALVGGELAAGGTYSLVAHTSCPAPISADCYTIMTTPGSGAPISASGTATAAQWDSFTPVVISAAAQTVTLPVATSLSAKGGLPIITLGNPITLAPNSADGINGGTINVSVTIPANTFTLVSTSGSSGTGAFKVPLGPVAGTNMTITANSDGTTTFASAGGGGITCPTSFSAVSGVCAWSQTVAGSSDVAFTGLTLNDYELVIDNLGQSAVDTVLIRFAAANTNYLNAGFYNKSGVTTMVTEGATPLTTGIDILSNGSTTQGYTAHGWIHNLRSGNANKQAEGVASAYDGTNYFTETFGGVYKGASTDVSAVHFIPPSGTVTGTITLITGPR